MCSLHPSDGARSDGGPRLLGSARKKIADTPEKMEKRHPWLRIGMRHTTRPPKRVLAFEWPDRVDRQIKDLFTMPPVKIDQAEKLPDKGGVFLVTDSDGVIHVRTSKSIRRHAERVCSTNPKSDLAQAIALRRTGIATIPSPHGRHTKKHQFRTNMDLIDAKRRALAELPNCDIQFVVEDDCDRRAMLKMFVEMHLGHLAWRAKYEPKGKYRKRLIGLAKN